MSWGAIFAGALVTIAIFVTLQLLGAGIGLAAVDLTGREVTSGTSLGIGAAVWWLIAGLISLFIGGWVAGRLALLPNKLDRALHGLTTWALFYVAMFLLATTALSALVGGGLSMLGQGAQAAGQAAASPQGQQALEDQLRNQGLTPEQIRDRIAAATGPGTTPEEQQAKETGEQAANITGGTFIGLAIAMLLGAVAAALGSLLAPAPRYVPPQDYGRTTGVRAEAPTYVSR